LGIALEERHLFRVLLLVELAALEGNTNSQQSVPRDIYWSYDITVDSTFEILKASVP
jgi:hypothetical protein